MNMIFDDKKRNTLLIAQCFGLSALILGLLLVFLAGTVRMYGSTLNIQTFIAWILEIMNIRDGDFWYCISKCVIGLAYVGTVVRLCINIGRSVAVSVECARGNKEIPYRCAQLVQAYTYAWNMVLGVLFFLICVSLLCNVEIDTKIHISLLVLIPFMMLMKLLKELLCINEKDRFPELLTDAGGSMIAAGAAYFILRRLLYAAIPACMAGFKTLDTLRQEDAMSITDLLINGAPFIIHPIVVVVAAFLCFYALRNALETEYTSSSWKETFRRSWFIMFIWLTAEFVLLCLLDGAQLYAETASALEFTDLLLQWLEIGKNEHWYVILMSVVGMIAVWVKPMSVERASEPEKFFVNPTPESDGSASSSTGNRNHTAGGHGAETDMPPEEPEPEIHVVFYD